jgi:hypothetical protein
MQYPSFISSGLPTNSGHPANKREENVASLLVERYLRHYTPARKIVGYMAKDKMIMFTARIFLQSNFRKKCWFCWCAGSINLSVFREAKTFLFVIICIYPVQPVRIFAKFLWEKLFLRFFLLN